MKRRALVGMLFVLSLITYIDRAVISSAKGDMAAHLALSDQSMGAVFSVFALGYALAQIPSGWLADRYGPRLALAAIVAVWSLLTAGTGAVGGLGALLAARFLFGVAEAGAFPGAARAISNWLDRPERGLANGIIFSGSRLGAALAFPMMAWLLEVCGWRVSFYLLAAPGLAWALLWWLWFRDRPAEAPAREPEAAGPSARLSGKALLGAGFHLAMVQYFAGNFTFFICLSWMHPYLKATYRLSQGEAALYAMLPLLLGATAQWAAGWLVDKLYASRYRSWSRRLPAMLGFLLAALGVAALTLAASPLAAAVCFALATFGADMTISPSWAYCQDIGGKNTGALSGAMNMAGNLGSFVSANAFPYLAGLTGSAAAYFLIAALLNLASVACWQRMRSVTAQAEAGL